jgi:positive regulator of sigma E activity
MNELQIGGAVGDQPDRTRPAQASEQGDRFGEQCIGAATECTVQLDSVVDQADIHARVGQRVLFEVRDEKMTTGALLIFILPLVALFLGAWLGGFIFLSLSWSVLAGRIVVGALFLALSAAVIWLLDKKRGARLPSIVKIIG